ncbi:MAG: baseplate J/gp47 family protein [Desulfobacterales bacterium]|nr:baseplate J/gp47 family protein [Desulfobacterales bacterium]
MNDAFSAIDLSKLPAPQVVEELSFEATLEDWKADFLERYPEAAAELDLESDPVVKLMQTGAYREMGLRQRVNDGAKAVMLAFSEDGDLDHLAAITPVKRKTLDPGDPDAVPPVEPTMESNDDFRGRVQMAPEGFSTAGPDGAYIFHAVNVTDVRDASVDSPAPVEVVVTILSHHGDGTPTAELITEVDTALQEKMVRPLTDQVTVQGAEILNYMVSATLEFYDGPDQDVVTAEAVKKTAAYTAAVHKLGDSVTDSGLKAALHQPGVKKVHLITPAADIIAQGHQAPFCIGITVGPA